MKFFHLMKLCLLLNRLSAIFDVVKGQNLLVSPLNVLIPDQIEKLKALRVGLKVYKQGNQDVIRSTDNCRKVEISSSVSDRTLVGHVIKRIAVKSPDACEMNCFLEADCFSFNIGPQQDGKHPCELNDSDHKVHPEDLVYGTGITYESFENLCSSNPCPVNSRCQTGFSAQGYRCVCAEGLTGQNCSEDVNECITRKHNCDKNAMCINTQRSFNCSCKKGFHGDGVICTVLPLVQVIPNAITIEEGTKIVMICKATGYPLPVITWSKSEGTLPASRSIVKAGNLTILNASTNDTGSFVCTATSIMGSNSSSVHLQVYSALRFITRPPSFIRVFSGQTLNLSCSASSDLQTNITWVFNGITSFPKGVTIDASNNLIILSANFSHGGNYTCTAMTLLSARHANVSLHVKIPETCSRVKANISDVSGDYVIDLDGKHGEAPFTVFCNMTDKGGIGVTVVSHDSESRTHVNGFKKFGGYSRDVTYVGSSIFQLKALTAASNNCQQFIKYECHAARIMRVSWWVSRDGENMTYWGGGATEGCACGVNGSCADDSKLCNCDKNDKVWRQDSGLLSNKVHLPVKRLRIGDTDAGSEEAYYTLGKLECFGIN